MKRKNASISNADILYNYVHNNCPRRFFIDFYGVSSILSTLFMLCGQIVDKLSSVDKFIIFLFLTIPYFIRVCEVIYHNSFYTFFHFHMDIGRFCLLLVHCLLLFDFVEMMFLVLLSRLNC